MGGNEDRETLNLSGRAGILTQAATHTSPCEPNKPTCQCPIQAIGLGRAAEYTVAIYITILIKIKNSVLGEFPGGLVVRIPGSHCQGLGSIPGGGLGSH